MMLPEFMSINKKKPEDKADPKVESIPLVSAKLYSSDGRVAGSERRRWQLLCGLAASVDRLNKSIAVVLFILLIMVSICAWVTQQIYPVAAFSLVSFNFFALAALLVAMILTMVPVLIFAQMVLSPAAFWAFPSHLFLNKSGFALGKPEKFVLWNEIKLIRIRDYQYRGMRLSRVVEIYISAASFARARSRYLPETNYFHYFDPQTGKLAQDEFEGVCIRLPVDLFRFDEDLQKFLHAAAANAPAQAVHFQSQSRSILQDDGSSFTALWLNDLKQGQEGPRILANGTSLKEGRYIIRSLLGVGGSSVVYDAVDCRPDGAAPNAIEDRAANAVEAVGGALMEASQAVALKELLIQSGGTRAAKDQIFRSIVAEINLLRKLDHPNIVHCLDYFMAGGRIYMVLEAIAGKNLRDYVRENGPLPFVDLMNVAAQACSILAYLHGLPSPMVHRDFTPDNLIWDGKKLSLIDFNVAEEVKATGSQTIVGKQCYLAPEQWYGTFTPAGDLYQLGCTLFYLAVGHDPEPLTQSDPEGRKDLPVSFCRMIVTLTSREPEKRYQSAAEAASVLTGVV